MSLLSDNLRALYGRHPGLRGLGLESAGEGPLAVESSACGLPTAKFQDAYLHSRYDPREEARRSSWASAWDTCRRSSWSCTPGAPWR